MDERLKRILNALPQKAQRSCLEPYRELIEELRKMGRTYRDIAAILAEKCELHLSSAAVHNFARVRSRWRPKVRTSTGKQPLRNKIENAATDCNDSACGDVQQRFAALGQKNAAIPPASDDFQFDPDEPLRLVQPSGREQEK